MAQHTHSTQNITFPLSFISQLMPKRTRKIPQRLCQHNPQIMYIIGHVFVFVGQLYSEATDLCWCGEPYTHQKKSKQFHMQQRTRTSDDTLTCDSVCIGHHNTRLRLRSTHTSRIPFELYIYVQHYLAYYK